MACHAALLFISLLSALTAALAYYPHGYITAPLNGTALAPGQRFNFTYNVRSDYCVSSFNYTVWLFTSIPSGLSFIGPDNQVATGAYLGRYANSNSGELSSTRHPDEETRDTHIFQIGNQYPINPAPPTLVMPNFSQRPGGFAAGATGSNVLVYLAVLEEWAQCSVRFLSLYLGADADWADFRDSVGRTGRALQPHI
jgi:hypothetical protein